MFRKIKIDEEGFIEGYLHPELKGWVFYSNLHLHRLKTNKRVSVKYKPLPSLLNPIRSLLYRIGIVSKPCKIQYQIYIQRVGEYKLDYPTYASDNAMRISNFILEFVRFEMKAVFNKKKQREKTT